MKHLKTYENISNTILDCANKQLTELPELPDTLKTLDCDNNQLTELPELPDTLQYLYCNNNQLTELPELPDTLLNLRCSDNQLPYNDLKGYKIWYAKTYPERIEAKKYNI